MSCLRDSIRQIDPCLQELIEAIENASSLTLLILSAWRLASVLAVRIVEEALTERARHPTHWPNCPKCGKRLHSKGFVPCQITSVIGVIRWKRRVGRCPHGCAIGQIAPLDNALGLLPYQRTSVELQQLGCLLAIFVPFETLAVLLNCLISVKVSATSVWHWVQKAMDRLNDQFHPWSHWMRQLVCCLCLWAQMVLWFPFAWKVARSGGKSKWQFWLDWDDEAKVMRRRETIGGYIG